MTSFGILTSPTEYSMSSTELAQWMEAKGFESIWFPEHSHIPTSRRTPFHGGGELPEQYKEFFDPFVGLTAAAAVTSKLKLGTGVCIVPEHNVINLAKAIACLDRVSNGRFILGIGAGWNAEEMADHGADFKDRWKVTRETVLAMKEIWTRDIAEYTASSSTSIQCGVGQSQFRRAGLLFCSVHNPSGHSRASLSIAMVGSLWIAERALWLRLMEYGWKWRRPEGPPRPLT